MRKLLVPVVLVLGGLCAACLTLLAPPHFAPHNSTLLRIGMSGWPLPFRFSEMWESKSSVASFISYRMLLIDTIFWCVMLSVCWSVMRWIGRKNPVRK